MRGTKNTTPALVALAFAAGCVEAKTPPAIPHQAAIPYGPKVYLVDDTSGGGVRDEVCTRLAELQTTTSTTPATIVATDDVTDNDGNPKEINPRVPHNCYVEVKPKMLRIDMVEVTNELFQLCVDSGVCIRPDPADASKGQVCSSEDGFDRCPVVEVGQGEADRFCKFIGRRLPSGIEHVIARQVMAADTQDPSTIPVYPNGTREEGNVPSVCSAAILGNGGCSRPVPITVGADAATTKGAAPGDLAEGAGAKVYDLMGNAAEWSSDLLPAIRGLASGLPWFCQAPVLPVAVGEAPECPPGAGTICVYGQYQPDGLPLGNYPVCVAFPNLRAVSGAHGSLFGGSFVDNTPDRKDAGVFGRRTELSPDDQPGKHYGFRCAGDVGVDDAVEAP